VGGEKVSYDQIPGYSGFLPIYKEAVDHFQSGAVFVEVGVALGHSIAYLARQVIDSGKSIQIWAVDPWAGYARNGEQQEALGAKTTGDMSLFIEHMAKHAPEELEIIRIVRTESYRASRLFRKCHMVMIDGAHDFDSVKADINTWWPLVANGGWLCGDDHEPTYQGVIDAVEEAFRVDQVEIVGTTWRVRK
jgi:cephalosporin hydroxylase